ncbi:GNAT family N-acetyltransferase [bacterium]|nr:GNAT family N-acetyltransferase [bacterium]MCB2179227.1 GNAT family N-acetyltransferase [bacterium]
MITVSRFQHAEKFLETAGPLLYPHEIRNGLILGVVERLVGNQNFYGTTPYMAVLQDDDTPLLAAAMTPPYWLLLAPLVADITATLPHLIEDLLKDNWPLPAVHAVTPYSRQFAEQWAAQTGGTTTLDQANRLYTLNEVIPPVGVPGQMIQAETQHRQIVAEGMRQFNLDISGEPPKTEEKYRQNAERGIAEGNWFLWQVDGEIVSMCMKNRPLRQSCSISGVFTPSKQRRNGYAGACVAALSQKLLDDGFEQITLFTDLANPTANHIYMEIGYRPVTDFERHILNLAARRPNEFD